MSKINNKKLKLKKNLVPITCLTAYSKSQADILDGRVDLILIGDSLGTTLYGMKNTRSVSLEMMKNHGKAVVSNTKYSMTIVDMPYNTYRNKKEALKNVLDILDYHIVITYIIDSWELKLYYYFHNFYIFHNHNGKLTVIFFQQLV